VVDYGSCKEKYLDPPPKKIKNLVDPDKTG
jgi:hypothetical protein